jgi:hypothetical protein
MDELKDKTNKNKISQKSFEFKEFPIPYPHNIRKHRIITHNAFKLLKLLNIMLKSKFGYRII